MKTNRRLIVSCRRRKSHPPHPVRLSEVAGADGRDPWASHWGGGSRLEVECTVRSEAAVRLRAARNASRGLVRFVGARDVRLRGLLEWPYRRHEPLTNGGTTWGRGRRGIRCHKTNRYQVIIRYCHHYTLIAAYRQLVETLSVKSTYLRSDAP